MSDVPTPFLLIDEPVARENCRRMASYARGHRLLLRPHTKTHKSLHMARLQIDAGSLSGLTVAKVGEAEVMAAAGDDLLIAYPCVDANRCERIAQLARDKTVHVAIDSTFAADALDAAARAEGSKIGILVDLDVGLHRTGLQSPADALTLAQLVAQRANLRLDGLFCYPGHVWASAAEQGPALAAVAALLAETLELWRKSGLSAAIVSGGSTPSAFQSHLVPQLTEIRPGTYIYNDMNTVAAGFCQLTNCAAKLVCTVVSDAVPGKVVIDAGTKTLTSDRNITQPDAGFGYVGEYPEAKVVRLSEEHGELDVTGCSERPRLGQRVHVIPNHICPCVNLQDSVWLRTAGDALERMRVDARGRLS